MAIIHEIRADGFGNTKKIELNPRRAIIEHCKECVGFQKNEVRLCTANLCALVSIQDLGYPSGYLVDLVIRQ